MGSIFYLMGKSSTGKDTIYKRLMECDTLELNSVVMYTTRPIRSGETEGREYHFTDEAGLRKVKEEGRLVELRSYDTCLGVWHYFTVDDGQINLKQNDYLMIGTLESYHESRKYFGEDHLIPVLVDLEDGARLRRALEREYRQEEPNFQEVCRRFLADSADFEEDKILQAGIKVRFFNENLEQCVREITDYIAARLGKMSG